MPDSKSFDLVMPTVGRSRLIGAAILTAAAACGLAGYLLNPRLTGGAVSLTSAPILTVLATLAGTAGIIALLLSPKSLSIPQLVVLSAAVSVLVALAPLDRRAAQSTLWGFLLVAPWRYALTPLVVHFAFALGWPHRVTSWAGLIAAWYLLHAGLLVAAVGGLFTDERPLLLAIDETFRARLLEPSGLLVAVLVLVLALASADQRRSRRRSIGWALSAVLLGATPIVAATFLPGLDAGAANNVATSHLALVALPILGLAAILAIPFHDPLTRDLAAFRIAQQVLDTPELATGLRDLAESLCGTLEAQGVVVRLTTPLVVATAGTVRSAPTGPVIAEAEIVDDGRTLVAPIGRTGDPLGDVRIEGRFVNAFTDHEREWLMAVLLPLGPVIRTRWRDLDNDQRTAAIRRRAAQAADGLVEATGLLPSRISDDSMAVPPAVDAREVLSQLGEGVKNVSRQGEELESVATDVRTHTRTASDEIAKALDAISAMSAELGRVIQRSDEIASNNETVSGVAFRTHLLANNAALEATRAGSAGRTFGVLATEIGRLADTTAGTSTAISTQTAALTEEIARLRSTITAVRGALEAAIHEAEVSEEGSRRLAEAAAALEAAARSLRPAVDEANTVAKRRSARDQHLSATLERFLAERAAMARLLLSHRDALDKVGSALRRLEEPTTTSAPSAGRARERR
jgi:predicted  nucleic acid-binding Zn-ribbon protein